MFSSGEERLAVELKLLPGERRLEEAALVDEERDPDDHADREELWKDTHLTSTGGSGREAAWILCHSPTPNVDMWEREMSYWSHNYGMVRILH